MLTQQALHLELSEKRHDLVELASPQFIGPVAYAWDNRSNDDPTVLGVGPLAGTVVPGASGLVLAARSPLWDGFHPTMMEGAGLPFVNLGCNPIAIGGRCPQTSVLVLRRQSGALEMSVEPLDPEPIWGGPGGRGTPALLEHLLERHAPKGGSALALATGPAAAITRFGSIGGAWARERRVSPLRGWFRHGGIGSRLYQVHGLCGVVLCSTEPAATPSRSPAAAQALGRFLPEMTPAQLEAAMHIALSPRLLARGTQGAVFEILKHRALWFNSSSIYLSQEEREELHRRLLHGHFLQQLATQLAQTGEHLTCGETCPLACRKVVSDRVKEFETYASLGPQLGVVDQSAADALVDCCERLGLDPLEAGGITGWVMERMHRGLTDPAAYKLSERPQWGVQLDGVAGSQHNAKIAQQLLEGLVFEGWSEPLRGGLRLAARASGGKAASLAAYSANGETGGMAPYPFWTPGMYAPVPVSGEFHQYYGLEFVPPRVLGRKSAQRMAAELMLQNLGLCRLHRGWGEEALPDLVNQVQGTSVDWATYHRDLAHRIFRRRKARTWETERSIDLVACFLQVYQYDGAPDAELDRWVRRFHEDRASAARAFWSEINSGMEEILGS